MTMHSPISSRAALLALLTIPFACTLGSIEPDEIDIADDEVGEEGFDTSNGDGDGDTGEGTDEGDTEGATGDTTEGTTEDTTEDTSDASDASDTDITTDSGTETGETPCTDLAPIPVSLGSTEVQIVDGASELAGSCGAAGPEQVTEFTAPADGTYAFSVTDLDAVVYLSSGVCDPLAELGCAESPSTVEVQLMADEVVFAIVDSNAGAGSATLTITQL